MIPIYTPNPQYNPMPYLQQGQQMMQPQMQNQMNQPMNTQRLIGQMVASREEALAVPVDFSGQFMIFPSMGQNIIYVKRFNSNTGSADFFEYVLKPAEVQPQFASITDLDDLRADLKNEINVLKGAIKNVRHPEYYAGNASRTKSDGFASADRQSAGDAGNADSEW